MRTKRKRKKKKRVINVDAELLSLDLDPALMFRGTVPHNILLAVTNCGEFTFTIEFTSVKHIKGQNNIK